MGTPWAHQVLTVLDGRAWFHVGSSRSAIDVVWSSENRYDSHLNGYSRYSGVLEHEGTLEKKRVLEVLAVVRKVTNRIFRGT